MKKIVLYGLLFLSLFFVTGCGNEDKDKTDNNEVKEISVGEREQIMQRINDLVYMDFYNKDIVPAKLANQEILRLSYEILNIYGKAVPGELSFVELKNTARDYFGFSLEPENLVCDSHYVLEGGMGEDILLYDVNDGLYKSNTNHTTHRAGDFKTIVDNHFVKGEIRNGIYTVVVNKIFSKRRDMLADGYIYYYATYSDARTGKNELYVAYENDKDMFEKYSDKLVSYTYNFKLVDGNFVLSSYTRNN